MSDTEMRGLDAWIATNIFNWTVIDGVLCDPRPEIKSGVQTGEVDINPVADLPRYTTEPAAAMEVIDACCIKTKVSIFRQCNGTFLVEGSNGIYSEGPTIEQTLCEFAQKLFTK